jgi:carbamoyl-phosphate synthase large subunit
VELIESGEVSLVINTPQGPAARRDGYEIRSAAVAFEVPCITTIPGASAAVMGIEAQLRGEMTVRPLQELHAALRRATQPDPGPTPAPAPGPLPS